MEYEGDSELSRVMYDLLHESCLYRSAPPDEDVCAGILEIVRKDYWHRIWITQEVALARRAIIICGERGVSLDDFQATLMAVEYGIKSRFRNLALEYADFAWALPDNFYATMSLEARRRHFAEEPIRLADLVCQLSVAPERPFYSASDPRDIFFALLGVISDGKELGLEADYSKTCQQIHTAATKALIRDGDLHRQPFRLDLCVPREKKERHDDLPSWVPDWMSIGDIGVTVYPINHHGPFSAAAGMMPNPVANDDKTALCLRRPGCYVDVIAKVMPPPQWTQPDKWTAHRIQDSQRWIEAVHHFAGLGPASGPAEDYVWRTLMMDTRDGANRPNKYEPTPPSEDSLRLVRRVMRQESIDVDRLTPAEAEFIRKELYDLCVTPEHINTLEEQLSFAMENWPETIGSVAYGRTLFKTAKCMFGLGHVAVKPGDIVTLQWGLDSPIILRPRDHTDGGYTFVGDAYVDGIMYGEFLETKPTETLFDIF
ncbi:hypothetical protein PG991_015855 [Apiospora marii]|uniref:Heterokaryon incompatibility domain-containing protein n=1 Tax=Apiospora marii TaxID=335849 RepID=A0ABR1QZV0_9PEZI